jgi:hypothetical protein
MTAKQTFATICTALADAKSGFYVMVSTSRDVDPTAYIATMVTLNDGKVSSIDLLGRRGAKRRLVVAGAEKRVLLCKGTHSRVVVQAWVEPAFGTPAAKSNDVEQLRAELYDTNAALVAARADLRLLNDAHAELGSELDAVETQRDAALIALAQLRNIAGGRAPGTTPLPSNTSPSTVAIEVTAALYRGAIR